MEKIQAAIAKARAQRQDIPPPRAPRSPAPGVEVTQSLGLTAEQTEDLACSAAWAALPALEVNQQRLARNHVVTPMGGHESATFDVMRTKLLQQMRANNWRRLAITSPTPGCGKSTIAMNLAFSIARQPDLRCMLLEIDLRRPSLAQVLNITAAQSFAAVLDGSSPFESNAQKAGDNLIVSVNSKPWRNPAELLNGPQIGSVLSELEAIYRPDVMIFDMPPMLVNDDAMAFIGHADCALLLAGAEATTIKEIDICERDLATQTNVLGVVLNKCRYMGQEYGYGYYN
jgi:protein-tyrosine kinase